MNLEITDEEKEHLIKLCKLYLEEIDEENKIVKSILKKLKDDKI